MDGRPIMIIKTVLISLLMLAALAAAGQPRQPPAPAPSATAAPPVAAYTPLSKQATDRLLDQISNRLGVVRSFQSVFVQERHLAIFEDVLTGKGFCFFEAPDKFRWELAEPYVSVLIFNRNEVGKFEFKDRKLGAIDTGAGKAMSELLGQMTHLMRGDFKASQEAFTVSALQGKDTRIDLTPRIKALGEYIRAIELTLDPKTYQVFKIIIREPEGDFIQIVFSDVRENVPFARALFDTKNPSLTNAGPGRKG